MPTRREVLRLCGAAAACAALGPGARGIEAQGGPIPDFRIEIAPYSLEVAKNKFVKTIAYNGQVPGPLLRMHEGRPVVVDVTNRTGSDELVHWHGQFAPPAVDGAMEEGTPMVAPGQTTRYSFTPGPVGFRWYHTHTFAGSDMKKATYTGQHGFVYVAPTEDAGRYDQEIFLALHDWDGQMLGSGDGSLSAVYEISTINGRKRGFSEPLRVKSGQRVLLHLLNASATDPHWISMAGHEFEVVALDGNLVARPQKLSMLRLAPAERVSAVVEMKRPGVWVLGEVRKHIQEAGMGMVIEYEGQSGKPQWIQPETLVWDYSVFAETSTGGGADSNVVEVPLEFTSKFQGHGAMDRWMINGKSYPHTNEVTLKEGQRYRLVFKNSSQDDHPVHLHRHSFELKQVPGHGGLSGVLKDVVLVGAGTEVHAEFTANNPGATLFHCHQQDHMDMGFMMMFRYA